MANYFFNGKFILFNDKFGFKFTSDLPQSVISLYLSSLLSIHLLSQLTAVFGYLSPQETYMSELLSVILCFLHE